MKCLIKPSPAFVLILFVFSVQAQKHPISISFSPLPLMDHIGMPSIQGGLELSLGKRISWMNEVGIEYRKRLNEKTDTSFLDSKGYKLKSELRYYLYPEKNGVLNGGYIGANIFFIHDIHNTQLDYYHQKDSSIIRRDEFGVTKNVYGINILFGFQEKIFKGFAIDSYVGMGVRYREVRTIHQEFDENIDQILQPVDLNVVSMRKNVDAGIAPVIVPHITLGVRLCYQF